jgi:hypothetical protein
MDAEDVGQVGLTMTFSGGPFDGHLIQAPTLVHRLDVEDPQEADVTLHSYVSGIPDTSVAEVVDPESGRQREPLRLIYKGTIPG